MGAYIMKNMIEIVEERKQELFEILSNLIKFDSQNFGSYGLEKEISEYIRDEINNMGYTADMYSPLDIDGFEEHVDYWPNRTLENRYNVSVVIRGKDSSKRIMIAAHNDTVPIADLSNWDVDPLGGEIKDGRIYGRGACDDKYGIAVMMLLLRIFKEEKIMPEYDLVFTAFCDEEYGGSNGALAACLRYPCDEYVILDCKSEIWNLASGGGEFKVYIKSEKPLSCCAPMLEGLNIVKAELDDFKERRKTELNELEECRGTIIPETATRLMEIRSGNEGFDLNQGLVKVCFYTAKTKEEIFAEFDEMGKTLSEKLEAIGLKFVKIEMTTRFFHFGRSEKKNPALDAMLKSGRAAANKEIRVVASCLSDLSIFLKYGSPRAFAYGAGRKFDEIGGAHQPNEFIECSDFLEFAKTIANFVTLEF